MSDSDTVASPTLSLSVHLDRWGARLHRSGLDGLAEVLLDVLTPLAPLGAGLLYVAQPTLGLALPRALIGELAATLDAPDAIEQIRCGLGLGDDERDTKAR